MTRLKLVLAISCVLVGAALADFRLREIDDVVRERRAEHQKSRHKMRTNLRERLERAAQQEGIDTNDRTEDSTMGPLNKPGPPGSKPTQKPDGEGSITEKRGGQTIPTKPSSGEEKPTKPSSEEGKPTRPSSGEEKPTRPSSGEEKPTRPSSGEEKPTRPSSGEEKPTRPSSGEEKPTRPSSGQEKTSKQPPTNGGEGGNQLNAEDKERLERLRERSSRIEGAAKPIVFNKNLVDFDPSDPNDELVKSFDKKANSSEHGRSTRDAKEDELQGDAETSGKFHKMDVLESGGKSKPTAESRTTHHAKPESTSPSAAPVTSKKTPGTRHKFGAPKMVLSSGAGQPQGASES